MKSLPQFLDKTLGIMLLVVAGGLPVLFMGQMTDFYEIPKLTFLIIMTLAMLAVWIFSWVIKAKISVVKTPLDLPMLLMLVIVVVSMLLSQTRYPAIFGNFPRVHGSAVAWVTYILLFFVTVSNLRSLERIKNFVYVLYGSAAVVAVITLMSYFGIYLPFDFAAAVNFTPTGSTYATLALLTLLLPLPMMSLARPNKVMPVPVAMGVAVLFGVVLALLGYTHILAIVFIVGVLSLLWSNFHNYKTLGLFMVPAVVIVMGVVLTYAKFPGNFFADRMATYPREIQLPLGISWKIAASAFRDAPFVGTGPGTFIFNFSAYKPVEFNSQNYWSFAFDTAHNEYLQILGTLGILGLAVLVIVSAVVVMVGKSVFLAQFKSGAHHDQIHGLLGAMSLSGVTGILLMLTHASSMVSLVVTMWIFGMLMMLNAIAKDKVADYHVGFKTAASETKSFDLLPVIVFLAFLVGAVPFGYQFYKAVSADLYHRRAIAMANTNGNMTYQYLQRAETLNPYIDLYRVDMAQTNFALANAIAAQRGPSQASPSGSLTDRDKETIQVLLSQAVTEARVAVALSPRSSRNWETLAAVYRNITGVANNALTFALDAYGQAIQRDPLNPMLRLNVGGLYYQAKNYDLAVRFFTDAVNLKPDYANAYYNLAIALRDKGDLENAKSVAEQTVALLAKDTTDNNYKVAVTLLDDLKTKVAARQAAQNANRPGLTPPAATTGSALTNPNLPDVPVQNLQNPPQVVPPAEVEKNPDAVLP